MGRVICADPNSVQKSVRQIRPGDILELEAGRYREPVVISDLSGTASNPIMVQSNHRATFGSDQNFEIYRETGNRIAKELERSGRYPGLYHVADGAYLILRNC